jgi:hypothetical protein
MLLTFKKEAAGEFGPLTRRLCSFGAALFEEDQMNDEPLVEPVKNGWHALSKELHIAVRGATRDEAVANFKSAAAQFSEIRSRPDPGGVDRFANPS